MKVVFLEGECPDCTTVVQRKEPLKNIDQEFTVTCPKCDNRFNLPVKGLENFN